MNAKRHQEQQLAAKIKAGFKKYKQDPSNERLIPKRQQLAANIQPSLKKFYQNPSDESLKLHEVYIEVDNRRHPSSSTSTLRVNPATYNCVLCKDTSFTQKEDLANHVRYHGKMFESVTHNCAICNKQFEKKAELVSHVKFHRSLAALPKTVPCDWCPKMFEDEQQAYRHKSIAHRNDGGSFDCPHCGKSYGFSRQMQRHVELEHQNMQYSGDGDSVCAQCQKVFTSVGALLIHAKKHEIPKKDSFYMPRPSRQLKLNSKSQVRPIYYCPYCACEYIAKFNMKRHILKDHHDRIIPDLDQIKTCKQCNAVFFDEYAFQKHNRHSVNDLFMSENELSSLVIDLD